MRRGEVDSAVPISPFSLTIPHPSCIYVQKKKNVHQACLIPYYAVRKLQSASLSSKFRQLRSSVLFECYFPESCSTDFVCLFCSAYLSSDKPSFAPLLHRNESQYQEV